MLKLEATLAWDEFLQALDDAVLIPTLDEPTTLAVSVNRAKKTLTITLVTK